MMNTTRYASGRQPKLALAAVIALSLTYSPSHARATDAVLPHSHAAQTAVTEPLQITQGWIRRVPPVAHTTAAYLVLHNRSQEDLTLTAIASPVAENTEMHATLIENGMMKMRKQEQLTLPGQGQLTFSPGGMHIMLTGLKHPLQDNEKVALTFYFKNAGPLTFELPVTDGAPATTSDSQPPHQPPMLHMQH